MTIFNLKLWCGTLLPQLDTRLQQPGYKMSTYVVAKLVLHDGYKAVSFYNLDTRYVRIRLFRL